jgi:hypothetical protein
MVGLSRSAAGAHWACARAWLHRRLKAVGVRRGAEIIFHFVPDEFRADGAWNYRGPVKGGRHEPRIAESPGHVCGGGQAPARPVRGLPEAGLRRREALNRQVRELQSGSPAPVPKARRGIPSGPSGPPDGEVSAHLEIPD